MRGSGAVAAAAAAAVDRWHAQLFVEQTREEAHVVGAHVNGAVDLELVGAHEQCRPQARRRRQYVVHVAVLVTLVVVVVVVVGTLFAVFALFIVIRHLVHILDVHFFV